MAAVLDACDVGPDSVAVDLGCGSGQITLPLAERCGRVLGVDVDREMVAMLESKARDAGLSNLHVQVHSIEAMELEPASVDLVVTNYALHHLRDPDKARLLEHALLWLRPGGQLVIGDMMFGRGSTPQDRRLIRTKIRTMARRGPAGWWRILKNLWRFSLRISEKPLTVAGWGSLIQEAGFEEVTIRPVVQEAHVLSARRPPVD